MAQPDLSACLSAFCNDFRAFSSSLEKSCKDLRRAVAEKGHAYVEDSHVASLIEDLGGQVESVEEDVSALEATTVDTISAAELLGHCNQLYLQNESTIRQLEEHLEQYGYVPVQIDQVESASRPPQSAKPSPFGESDGLRTPSWGSSRKSTAEGADGRNPQSTSGRPALSASDASLPAGDAGDNSEQGFASPSKPEETTLELRRDILNRKVSKPAPPPSPGSPQLLSLADLGLSASSLEAIKDDGGHPPARPAPVPSRLYAEHRPPSHQALNFDRTEPQPTPSMDFETPRPRASGPSSQPSTSAPLPNIAQVPESNALPPGISTRQQNRGPLASTVGGDSLFPLAEPVSQAELDSVPFFLRAQVSLQDLNAAIQKINDSVTDKRFSDQDGTSTDLVTQDDLAALKLGPRLKAYLLLLVRLDRIVAKHVGGATVYALQAGPRER